MAFDRAKIYVRGGDGGNGAVSFRREKFVPYGGPDGGDGGRGGSVYLVGDESVSTLMGFSRRRHHRAERGSNGMGRNKHGAKGRDLWIPVPLGTVVRTEAGEELGDVVESGQMLLVAKGGRGGLGNSHFATATNQAPRVAQKGEPGEERWLLLELKLIADVGVIGLPNAGKSTFLAAVTRATPKIADYPFTTLVPNLGVAVIDHETFVVADIPGLIEGAHTGKGLGHEFLRHIERTKVLVHLIDGSQANVRAAYEQVNRELELFDGGLSGKPQLVAINKMDLPEVGARREELLAQLGGIGWPVFAISAASGEGVRELLLRTHARLRQVVAEEPPREAVKVFRPRPVEPRFAVKREDDGWRVSGKRVERAAVMTDCSNEEAIRLLHKELTKTGVVKALAKEGAREGDLVRIGGVELIWGGDQPPRPKE